MNIVIKIESDCVELILRDHQVILDIIKWEEKLDLSQRLLSGIDQLLVKNNLKIKDIDKIEVESFISSKLTTVRIAKVVAKTLSYGKDVE